MFCEAVGLVDLVFDDVTFFVDSVADFTVVVFGVVDFAVVLDALFGALVLVVRGGISSVFTVIIFSVFGVGVVVHTHSPFCCRAYVLLSSDSSYKTTCPSTSPSGDIILTAPDELLSDILLAPE